MPGAGRTHGPPATRKAGGSHHRSSQYNRHSLRDGLRLIARSPRRPGFDCLRRQRTRPAGLIPASGDQDHTPSPSAAVLLVQQRPDVHRIPHSTSVTIAIRPSCGARDGGRETTYFRKTEAEYFWPEGLTRFPINRRDMPSGKSPIGGSTAILVAREQARPMRQRCPDTGVAFIAR
jgi:hypothetical protein